MRESVNVLNEQVFFLTLINIGVQRTKFDFY